MSTFLYPLLPLVGLRIFLNFLLIQPNWYKVLKHTGKSRNPFMNLVSMNSVIIYYKYIGFINLQPSISFPFTVNTLNILINNKKLLQYSGLSHLVQTTFDKPLLSLYFPAPFPSPLVIWYLMHLILIPARALHAARCSRHCQPAPTKYFICNAIGNLRRHLTHNETAKGLNNSGC